jgi:hypothetical protein
MPEFIKFLGGPIDGHRHDLSGRTMELPTLLDLEIGPNTYRRLANQPITPGAPTTSLATYELRMVNGEARYYFIAAKKPAQKPTAGR